MGSEPKRSERLGRVADLARDSEKSAARRVAEAQHHVDDGRQQLEELQYYRSNYTALVQAAGKSGNANMESLRNHRAFLSRLSAAIADQKGRMDEIEQRYEQRRREWLSERARARALDKVVETHRAAEIQVADKRESREQDERAQHTVSRWSVKR